MNPSDLWACLNQEREGALSVLCFILPNITQSNRLVFGIPAVRADACRHVLGIGCGSVLQAVV